MSDITLSEIQAITRKVNETTFPYMESYERLNKAIIAKAKKGNNSISFDFVDTKPNVNDTFEQIQTNYNRIYPLSEKGQALHNVYDYPRYLMARGFKVEIRKSLAQRGYLTKSYFISW